MREIDRILTFMIEIEQLKGVHRKSKPIGLERYENSAEHSWHVCLSALMLRDYANEDIDIDRVIKMLLIHDLGEIDAGDTMVYESNDPAIKQREEDGLKRLLMYLSDERREEYMALWHEFEFGDTADARFARAIDRVPPLLQNVSHNGHGWKKHNIPKEKVFALNARIDEGSTELWQALKVRLEDAVEKGILR